MNLFSHQALKSTFWTLFEMFLSTVFEQRFSNPREDHVPRRMQILLEMWVQAVLDAGTSLAWALAKPLERGPWNRLGDPGVRHDTQGSGLGFKVVKNLTAQPAELPSLCRISRPPPPKVGK